MEIWCFSTICWEVSTFRCQRKYVIPAAKRVGDDLMEFVAPEFEEVVNGRKGFKSSAKCIERQTLSKKIGSW